MSGSYDAIVIGSGFGGAVTAANLTAAGRTVLLLEKGHRWRSPRAGDPTGTPPVRSATTDAWGNPEYLLSQSADLRYVLYRSLQTGTYGGGLYEDYMGDDLQITVARGYGGGSLVYAQLNLRAPSETFASPAWRAVGMSRSRLDPYYERVERTLMTFAQTWSDVPRRAAVVADCMARLGVSCEPAPLGNYRIATDSDRGAPPERNSSGRLVRPCNGCGFCSFGCTFDARQTLPLNYLARAEDSGRLDVRTDASADAVEPAPGGGWRVHWQDLRTGRWLSETAPVVVVSAGTVSSSELLLRARDVHRTLPGLSEHVGRHVSANGDVAFGALLRSRGLPADVARGHIIALISYHWWRTHGFVIEDVGTTPVGAAKYPLRAPGAERYWGPELKALLKDHYAHDVVGLCGMGLDGADGEVRLGSDGLARVGWASKLVAGDKTFDLIEGIRSACEAIVRAGGGELLRGRDWDDRRRIVTVHPLGGCRMAASAADGVVDPSGMVFDHPGLFVVDGSIMPAAVGVNPSLTIAACAEALSEGVLDYLEHAPRARTGPYWAESSLPV